MIGDDDLGLNRRTRRAFNEAFYNAGIRHKCARRRSVKAVRLLRGQVNGSRISYRHHVNRLPSSLCRRAYAFTAARRLPSSADTDNFAALTHPRPWT
jgi:hypothetical protein